MKEEKKLLRSKSDYVLAGVCGGLANYLAIDPIVIRLIFIILTFGGGSGIIIYILLALVLPNEEGESKATKRGENFEEMANTMGQRVKTLAEEFKNEPRQGKSGHSIVALGLILLGVLLLSNQLMPNWFRWDIFWPMAVILAGVYLLLRR